MIGSFDGAGLARPLEQLAQRDLDAHLEREREPRALVHERRDRDRPAVVLAPDDVLVRDPRLLDEQLVELGLAGDLAQRADLDPVLLHVHQEVGQPAVLGRVGVGAREQHAPLRLVGHRRPHLLAGDDPLVARRAPPSSSATRGRSPTAARRSPGTRSRRRTGSARGSAPSARRCRGRSPSGRPSRARACSPSAARSARATSSEKIACSNSVAPEPPYCSGQLSPAQPRSLSLRCQARRNSKPASSPSGVGPGWFSSSQLRTSSRNSCSLGDRVRSMATGR